MKKVILLLSVIFSLIPIVEAQTIITEQPEGTLKEFTRSGTALMGSYGEITEYKQQPTFVDIVYGEDGKTVYMRFPLSSTNTEGWIKGELNSDATEMTFPAGQIVGSGTNVSWEDGSETPYELTLNVLQQKQVDEYNYTYEPAANNPSIKWNINKATGEITLASTDADAYHIIGFVYKAQEGTEINGTWNGLGDYNTILTPFRDSIVTVPEDLATQEYSFLYERSDTWDGSITEKGLKVKVRNDNDDYYIGGLSKSHPDIWVKGHKNDNTIIFPQQYLGRDSLANMGIYLTSYTIDSVEGDWGTYTENSVSDKPIVFNYNDADKSFRTEQSFDINLSNSSFSSDEMFENAKFAPFIDKAATPADPKITNVGTYESERGLVGFVDINIPTKDVDGNFIDPDKISFIIYKNATEPFVFNKENYTYTMERDGYDYTPSWEDGMTEIPFNIVDNSISNERVYLFFAEGLEEVGLQTIYRGGGEEHRSNIVFQSVDGIDKVANGSSNVTKTEYYNLSGQKMSAPNKGICIVKQYFDDSHIMTTKKIFK